MTTLLKSFAPATFLLLILLSFNACTPESASDVNQDRIYTEYELFYNANTDKTTAIARFRFGNITGTILELDSTAKVTFDGDALPYNAILAAHAKEYAGLKTTGTFAYTNINGDIFINTVPAFDPIAYPADFDTLRRSQAYAFDWQGTPLAADQNVSLTINGSEAGDGQIFFTDADAATGIVLGANQLANLGLGPATCFLDRSTIKQPAEAPTAGGMITGKYRALNAQIWIQD